MAPDVAAPSSTTDIRSARPRPSEAPDCVDSGNRAQAVPAAPPVICFPFADGLVGGSHISALKLVQALDRQEFEPLIVLHFDEGPLASLLRAEGLQFTIAPASAYLKPRTSGDGVAQFARSSRALLSLRRFLIEKRVRIVHTNEGSMHATWGLAARLAGAKHIWHHRGNPRAAGLRYLAPWLATKVIAVSQFARPAQGMFSARGKSSVIHSPFDKAVCTTDRTASRQAAIAELGLPQDVSILGFFAHFARRKRPLLFIDTVAEVLRRQRNPVVGLIFGQELEPGFDHAVRDRIRVLGLDQSIKLMGFCSPAEPWLAACDALVVTAVEEPFGRTLIEAMLLQTPVVAARSGGNLEAIRHCGTGLLVTPDDVESFADGICTLLDGPEFARSMARTANLESLARFGIENHVTAVACVYRQVLASCA